MLNNNGLFGIIVANKWMRSNYGEPLRKWLKQQTLHEIIDFGDLPVFESATTYPCILIVSKLNKKINSFDVTNVKTLKFESLQSYIQQNRDLLNKNSLDDKGWNLASDTENNLLNKLKNNSVSLSDYVKGEIFYGIKTGLNEAFVIDEATKTKLITEDKRSEEVIKPFLAGRDIKKYQTPIIDKYLIFFPKGFTNRLGNNPKHGWKWLSENFSAVASYLKQFEDAGKKRYDQGDYWWELRACDYYAAFEKPKIMLPDIALRMQALYDVNNFYCVNTAYIIPVDDKFLLGILNSNVVQYYYAQLSSSIRGGYLRFIKQYLATIPIPKKHQFKEEIINLVDQLLKLNKEKAESKLQTSVSQLEIKIDYCEDRINKIVYQLNELTADEIKIVEGK